MESSKSQPGFSSFFSATLKYNKIVTAAYLKWEESPQRNVQAAWDPCPLPQCCTSPGRQLTSSPPAGFNGPNHGRPGAQTQPNLTGTRSHMVHFKCKTVHFISLVPVCASKGILGEIKHNSLPRAWKPFMLKPSTGLYTETAQPSQLKSHTQEKTGVAKCGQPPHTALKCWHAKSGRRCRQKPSRTQTSDTAETWARGFPLSYFLAGWPWPSYYNKGIGKVPDGGNRGNEVTCTGLGRRTVHRICSTTVSSHHQHHE